MPTYEYRCPAGHDFEHFVSRISDGTSTMPCPTCGAVGDRRISAGGAILFKGSGFYITDYGKDGKKDQRAKVAASASSAAESSKGESSRAESSKGESSRENASRDATPGRTSDAKAGDAKHGQSSDAKAGGAKAADAKAGKPAAPPSTRSKGE